MRLPVDPSLAQISDIPHTISFAILYRMKIDSFNELPREKRPPRDLWDKPYRLKEFFDEVFSIDGTGGTTAKQFVEFDPEEVE